MTTEINPRIVDGEPVCSGDACPSSEVSNGYYICSIQSEPKCDRKSRKVVLANVCEPCIPGLRRQRDEGRVERVKSDRMREIGHEIRTQNNAITACPVFMVQRRRRIYGMDPAHAEAGDFVWVTEDEHIEADATEATTLDAKHAESADNRIDGFFRVAFIDLWENVQPFFTRKGAEEYLCINGHNIKPETRIYVESGWRNKEWEDIRAVLAAADRMEP